jgi:hypothetical protein
MLPTKFRFIWPKRKSAMENYILKFLTVSSVSSDSIVKGIIDDIIKTAVKTCCTLYFRKDCLHVHF